MVNAVPSHTNDVAARPQRGDVMVRRVQHADDDNSYVIVEWSHRYVLEGPFEDLETAAAKARVLAERRQVHAWCATEGAGGPDVVML